jgi:TrmH family RNA methyltransferase
MAVITSGQNGKVKLARGLRELKTRDAEGLFLVEGTFHIGAALEASAPIEYALYSQKLLRGDFAKQLIRKLEGGKVGLYEVSPEILASLSDKENPAGILAVARQSITTLSSFTIAASAFAVALVAPQDPGNVGSVLRTVDAAGASGLLLLDGGVDAYHSSAVRAAMGAHFWIPIVEAKFAGFTDWAQKNDIHVYGSSAHAQLDYRKANYQRPCVLLLGSEREGLTDAHMATCEQVVSMPMRGKVTSLNLAVAAGILLYEMGRFEKSK